MTTVAELGWPITTITDDALERVTVNCSSFSSMTSSIMLIGIQLLVENGKKVNVVPERTL